MKLHIEVVPRYDVTFAIEKADVEFIEGSSLYDVIAISAQKAELEPKAITTLLNGLAIPYEKWKDTKVKDNSRLIVILDPAGTIAAIVMAVIMVATFIYSMMMMSKLSSATGKDKSASSRSIYDVNAQGNKIKLGDVIPEQFGLFKKFPDYLADNHTYYKDNEMYLDMILSQGVGSFLYDSTGRNLYLGSTPISSLSGVQFSINEPGADLSTNSIDPNITKCWYNSTEVTSSGHTLHVAESQTTGSVYLEYQSLWIEDYDVSSFQVGDILRITGVSNEWCVCPALQYMNDGQPTQIDLKSKSRVSNKYKSAWDHPREYAIVPIITEHSNFTWPRKVVNYDVMNTLWSDMQTITDTSGTTKNWYVYANELVFSGSWCRYGSDDAFEIDSDGYTRIYWAGDHTTANNLSGLNWAKDGSRACPMQYGSHISGFRNGDAGQINCGCPATIYTYETTMFGLTVGTQWSFNNNDDFVTTYNGDDWSFRFKRGNTYTIQMLPCARVKVTTCDFRPELEGKYVDFIGFLDSESHYSTEAQVKGLAGESHSTLGITYNRFTHLIFDGTDAIAYAFQEWGQSGVEFFENCSTLEEAVDHTLFFLGYDNDDALYGGGEFVIDKSDAMLCTATRIIGTPSAENWKCYDADNGITDDNGYYKIVRIYGDNQDTDGGYEFDSISTPFGCDTGSRAYPLTDSDDSYCPRVTKIKVVRCDASGNEIPNWDGFWNCVSKNDSAVVDNLTKNLSTSDSSISGPYRASPVGVDASEIEVDLTAPSGIYYRTDKGDIENYAVTCRIEYKRAGDLSWQHRDVELSSAGVKRITSYNPPTYEQTGVDAVGITETFNLDAGDWYFRVYRITEEHTDDTTHYVDEVKWTGLKSVIANPQSYDDITTILLRFRGSETLSEMSENQISTLWTRKLPTLDDSTVLEPTSNLAPAIKYILDNSKFANLLSIDNLADMHGIWGARGQTLNGTLDSDNTLLQVLKDILHIGYSELSTTADGLRIVQVSKHDLEAVGSSFYGPTDYAFIFTPQNYNNLKIDVALPRQDDCEEVAVTYTDKETYKTGTVYVHINTSTSNILTWGNLVVTDYPTSIYSETLETFGVTDKDQAISMGARRLRQLKRQRVKISLTTEFDSLCCQYKDFVAVAMDDVYSSMLIAESRHLYQDAPYFYVNERTLSPSNAMDTSYYHSTYTGRIVAYDEANTLVTIYPPCDRWHTGVYMAFFVTDEVGEPHLVTLSSSSQWRSSTQIRVALPITWYGDEIDYPRITSCTLIPCWVDRIKPSEKNCTVELSNYDSSIFTDDLPIREGYGISEYGTSPYGISY